MRPRTPRRIRALTLALVLVASTSSGAAPASPASGAGSVTGEWLRLARPSGSIDFAAGVATARGVGRRPERDGVDHPLLAARTSLQALLYPHPVGPETTLGDLAAAHPDLTAALDLQLAGARVLHRRAIPPDLQEVTVELPLEALAPALAPFLLETAAPRPHAAHREGSPEIARVVLRLGPEALRRHVPPLLPSVRALSGPSALGASGAWLRRATRGEAVTYQLEPASPGAGSLELDVAAVGGLRGATLFLRDDDADRLRRALVANPEAVVVVAPAGPTAGPSSGPAPASSPAAPEEGPRPRMGPDRLERALARLREKVESNPRVTSPLPMLPDPTGRPGGAPAATAPDPAAAAPPPRPAPASPRPRPPDPPPRPAQPPPPADQAEEELPPEGTWVPFRGSPSPPQGVPPPPEEAGEPPDLVEPPAIRWQYFSEDGTEEGELP